MEFKDALKQKRKELGLTQTELAKRLGVTFTTVNRLEREIERQKAIFLLRKEDKKRMENTHTDIPCDSINAIIE